jgi:DNA invertase Pin-like site-specific DNA recombinase
MPSANRLTVGIVVTVAEERGMISKRTKDALSAAKTRGKMPLTVKWGP